VLIYALVDAAETRVLQLPQRLHHAEDVIHHHLVVHSVAVLRIALGAVFLGFGVLKFFPGVSPAEDLVGATTQLLTFDLISPRVSLVAVATLECFIGACLIAGRLMRLAVWLLALQLVGILAPLVFLTDRLFAGPHGAPTLEGQYVLKDVILFGAAMVVAAGTFRGGRLVRSDPAPSARSPSDAPLDGPGKLGLVLQGAGDRRVIGELCDRHGISESEFNDWREIAREGAARSLEEATPRAA
jgi:uncharacterized membrane protein YphA (DoxX/SURF4 family)